jgi:hypothetical protein
LQWFQTPAINIKKNSIWTVLQAVINPFVVTLSQDFMVYWVIPAILKGSPLSMKMHLAVELLYITLN